MVNVGEDGIEKFFERYHLVDTSQGKGQRGL